MAVTLELAISAIRAGRKQEGRQLLNLLIQQDPNNEAAWLWMSQVVDSDKQRERCLYHVLALNPASQPARRGLQLLGVVVTDSRPVKLPPDLQRRPPASNGTKTQPDDTNTQPALKKNSGDALRRPFLINPDTFAKELPFEPVKQPPREPVQASPAILSLKVDDEETAPKETIPAKGEEPAGKSSTPRIDTVTAPDSCATPPAGPVQASIDTPTAETEKTDAVALSASVAETETEGNPEAPAVTATTQPTVSTQNTAEIDQPTEPEMEPQRRRAAGPIILPVLAGAGTQAMAAEAQHNGSPRQPTANVGDHTNEPGAKSVAAENPSQPEAIQPQQSAPQRPPAEPVTPSVTEDVATTITQKMPSPFEQPQTTEQNPAASPALPAAAPQTDSTPVAPQPASPMGQTPSTPVPPYPHHPIPNQFAGQNNRSDIPLETRQSQPVLINFPMPNAGFQQDGQGYYPAAHQTPFNQPGQPQNQGYYHPQAQYHSSATMGMPMLPAGYNRPPSEPVPPIPAGHGHYSGQQLPPGMSLHSNATMMMPTMSEAEARARLATSQAIPTANAAAMPLQNGGSWPQPPGFGMTGYPQEYHEFIEDEEEEDDGEINILAVIIFGTLSITALGGLGMLVLLLVTTTPPNI